MHMKRWNYSVQLGVCDPHPKTSILVYIIQIHMEKALVYIYSKLHGKI